MVTRMTPEEYEKKYGVTPTSVTSYGGPTRMTQDEFDKKYGQTATVAPAVTSMREGKTGLGGFFTGLGQSGWNTYRGLNRLVTGALDQTVGRGVNALVGKGFTPTDTLKRQQESPTSPFGQKFGEYIQPQTTAEAAGRLTGDLAQYLYPATRMFGATATLPLATQVGLRTLPDVAISAMQSAGGDMSAGDVTKNVGVVTAASIVGNRLFPGAGAFGRLSSLGRGAATGYVADVGAGLTGARGETYQGPGAFIPSYGTLAGAGLGALGGSGSGSTRAQRAIDDLEDTFYKIAGERAPTRKKLAQTNLATQRKNQAGTVGVTPQRKLAEAGIVPEIQGTNFHTQAQADQLLTEVSALREANRAGLLEAGRATPPLNLADLEAEAIRLARSPQNIASGKANTMVRAIRKAFAEYRANYGNTISLLDADDIKSARWKETWRKLTAEDALLSDVNYKIGKAMQQSIERTALNAGLKDVAQLNREMGDLLEAVNFLKSIDGKPVLYGKMGTHMLRLGGAIAGAQHGIFGSVVGMLGGEYTAALLRSASVAGPVKRMILAQVRSEAARNGPQALADVNAWIAQQGLDRATRLALPAPRYTPMPAPKDISGVKVVPAKKTFGTDPDTGRFKRVYTSEPAIDPATGAPVQKGVLPSRSQEPINQTNTPTTKVSIPVTKASSAPTNKVVINVKSTPPTGKPPTAQAFAGAGMGFEKDENGNWRFNPEKAAMGMAMGVGAIRATNAVNPALLKEATKTMFTRLQNSTMLRHLVRDRTQADIQNLLDDAVHLAEAVKHNTLKEGSPLIIVHGTNEQGLAGIKSSRFKVMPKAAVGRNFGDGVYASIPKKPEDFHSAGFYAKEAGGEIDGGMVVGTIVPKKIYRYLRPNQDTAPLIQQGYDVAVINADNVVVLDPTAIKVEGVYNNYDASILRYGGNIYTKQRDTIVDAVKKKVATPETLYRAGDTTDPVDRGVFLSSKKGVADTYEAPGKPVQEYSLAGANLKEAVNRWRLVEELDPTWNKETIHDRFIKEGVVDGVTPEQRLQAEAEKRIKKLLEKQGFDGVRYSGGVTDQAGEYQIFNEKLLKPASNTPLEAPKIAQVASKPQSADIQSIHNKELEVLKKKGYVVTDKTVGWTLDNGMEHAETHLRNSKGVDINLYTRVRSNGDSLSKMDFDPLTSKPGKDFGSDIFKGTEFAYEASTPSKAVDVPKRLFHGTDADINKIQKEGLKMPSGVAYGGSGYPGIFTSADSAYSKTFGKNLLEIDTTKLKIARGKDADRIVTAFEDAADKAGDLASVSKKFNAEGFDAVEMADGIVFLRDIKPGEFKVDVPKADLSTQAKQYKTPEEFVKAQGDVVYHQSTKKGMPTFDAFFGTEKFQQTFPQEFGTELTEAVLPRTAKVLDLDLATKEGREFMAEAARKAFPEDTAFAQDLIDKPFTGRGVGAEYGIMDDFYGDVWAEKVHASAVLKDPKYAQYDAVKFQDEILIPERSLGLLKQKQELTDIWNRANPKKSAIPKKGESFAGAVAGFEQDEEGNLRFNPEKALAGMALGVGATKYKDKLINKINNKKWWRTSINRDGARQRGMFYASTYGEAEFYGPPVEKPFKVNISKPLYGDEETIMKTLGVKQPGENATLEQIFRRDKQMAKRASEMGYDSIVLMSNKGYKDFLNTGEVPRSVELNVLEDADGFPIHKGKDALPKTIYHGTPNNPKVVSEIEKGNMRRSENGLYGAAYYFTTKATDSVEYARNLTGKKSVAVAIDIKPGAKILKVDTGNPGKDKIAKLIQKADEEQDSKYSEQIRKLVMEQGYDGVAITYSQLDDDAFTEVVIYNKDILSTTKGALPTKKK